jgi:septal ring factor EnvC (AmiA/AmiB activator)
MRALWVIAAIFCLALPAPLLHAAADPVFAARKAAEDLQSATRALKDAREAKDRIAALSRAIRAYEDGLAAMREALRRATIREQALRLEFDARRDQLSRLLGVLQTMERASSPLLLIHPSGPLGTARSGQILSEVTPAVHAQAEELRAQLEELALLRALQTTAEEDVTNGLKGVQDARLALTAAIDRRTNLPVRYLADPDRLKTLAENADTLASFATGLADLPFEGADAQPFDFTAEKGHLPLPVYGTVLRHFNEADAAGLRRPGIIVAAPAVSLVSTPVPATIRYAGPLLDYENVIILEPQVGYLIVLAGLGQVYGEVGQILAAGDPVGLLGGRDPAARDFLVEATEGSGDIRQETLYIEIREDREAVDPGAWFAPEDR